MPMLSSDALDMILLHIIPIPGDFQKQPHYSIGHLVIKASSVLSPDILDRSFQISLMNKRNPIREVGDIPEDAVI